jgi:hypothetical protein
MVQQRIDSVLPKFHPDIFLCGSLSSQQKYFCLLLRAQAATENGQLCSSSEGAACARHHFAFLSYQARQVYSISFLSASFTQSTVRYWRRIAGLRHFAALLNNKKSPRLS